MEASDIELIKRDAPASCFVIHKQSVLRNLRALDEVVRETGIDLLMALKGFACPATFEWIRPYVKGIAASSPHEAELGHHHMGGQLHAYAPGYSEEDIDQLLHWIDHIVFNSREQTLRFAPKIKSLDRPIEIGVRLNPEQSETDTEIYDPSSKNSRLGIKRQEWRDDILPMISGIHVHNLCENDSFALERTLSALEEKFAHVLTQVNWVNFGGGHLISSESYNRKYLIKILSDWKAKYNHRIFLEPSETFGINAGVLKATVLDIKPGTTDALPHAILNVSATAHMPDTLEMPYRAEISGAGVVGEKPHAYLLGGGTCLAGDVIGEYAFDQPLDVGDSLIFMDMAHYTMVKTTFFNGVQMPAIALLDSDEESLRVIRTFGYEDFANKLG